MPSSLHLPRITWLTVSHALWHRPNTLSKLSLNARLFFSSMLVSKLVLLAAWSALKLPVVLMIPRRWSRIVSRSTLMSQSPLSKCTASSAAFARLTVAVTLEKYGMTLVAPCSLRSVSSLVHTLQVKLFLVTLSAIAQTLLCSKWMTSWKKKTFFKKNQKNSSWWPLSSVSLTNWVPAFWSRTSLRPNSRLVSLWPTACSRKTSLCFHALRILAKSVCLTWARNTLTTCLPLCSQRRLSFSMNAALSCCLTCAQPLICVKLTPSSHLMLHNRSFAKWLSLPLFMFALTNSLKIQRVSTPRLRKTSFQVKALDFWTSINCVLLRSAVELSLALCCAPARILATLSPFTL